jgi:hypothetical protein
MMFDVQNLFSDDQDLSQDAATYLSDKSIDLRANGTPVVGGPLSVLVGNGEPIELFCQVTEAFTSAGGNATLVVNLVHADDAALTSNLAILATAATITADAAGANAPAGFRIGLPRVLPTSITKRYLGLQYVIAVAATTAGKITAGLVIDRQTV